jgi:hypothetical protein
MELKGTCQMHELMIRKEAVATRQQGDGGEEGGGGGSGTHKSTQFITGRGMGAQGARQQVQTVEER